MVEFEIFYGDLNEEAQERLKEAFKLKDVLKETNWDVFPLSIIGNE